MVRLLRVVLIIVLLGGVLPAMPVRADTSLPPSFCVEVPQPPSDEVYLICVPPNWSAPFDVVVFAHGYVPPGAPMTQYYSQLMLPGDQFLPNLVNGLGYAFISTSYSKNGLAVKEGLADTTRLIQSFKTAHPNVGHVYLTGASEGGLVTTLAAEKGAPISGGLALCGPIGNFRKQIDYFGDFRVLFDYFFPGVLPPSPIQIPTQVIQNWETVYAPQIAGLIGSPANQHLTEQLLRTSHAPIDSANPSTAIDTTVGVLAYNVFATNDGRIELGGQPFDNKTRLYLGSDNDLALNGSHGVQRFKADQAALQEINRSYQTSGKLQVPLVTMHTLGDPIVPYWHEPLYTAKALLNGSILKHLNIPIDRYGHCTFTTEETLAGFAVLNFMVTGKLPSTAALKWTAEAQSKYQALVEQFRSQLSGK